MTPPTKRHREAEMRAKVLEVFTEYRGTFCEPPPSFLVSSLAQAFSDLEAKKDKEIAELKAKVAELERLVSVVRLDELNKLQQQLTKYQEALNEIHRLCRTLEPLCAVQRVIQVKEQALENLEAEDE